MWNLRATLQLLAAKIEIDLIFVRLSEFPKIFVCIFPAFKRVISHEIFLKRNRLGSHGLNSLIVLMVNNLYNHVAH